MPQRDANSRLGHPDVAAWVLGALDPDDAERFAGHLRSCEECQKAVAELEPVARMLQGATAAVPDATDAGPPADLRERTLSRVEWAALLAEPEAAAPEAAQAGPEAEAAAPEAAQAQPEAGAETAQPDAQAESDAAQAESDAARAGQVVKLSGWRRASVRTLSLAAAVIVAVAIGVAFWVSRPAPTALAFTIPLHATTYGGTASGQANAHHAANGWTISLTVHGLRDLGSGRFYECWYAGPGNRPGHPELITAGTFTVGHGGSATVRMWSAADPRTFPTMQITAERPGDAGQHGQVVLSGTAH